MREILFRGQTRRKGEKVWMDGTPVESNWVYGGVFQGPNMSIIYGYEPIEKHAVYTKTVGQFTGVRDVNGKRIFEGDICRNIRTDEIVLVKWHGTFAGYIFWNKRKENENLFDFGELFRAYDKFEVIGNVHDNPELLKGG